jgi:hypothetical protein
MMEGPPPSAGFSLMPNYVEVYVFLTSDRSVFGISSEPDGHDLPKLGKRTWAAYEVIP